MTTEARTASDADDGFHEIQLNGKQLVFLGMATTIVSVVIFLCGVLVGRGVRPLEPVAEAAAAVSAPAETPAEPVPAPVATNAPDQQVASAPPAPEAAAVPAPRPADPAPPRPTPEPAPAVAAPVAALGPAKPAVTAPGSAGVLATGPGAKTVPTARPLAPEPKAESKVADAGVPEPVAEPAPEVKLQPRAEPAVAAPAATGGAIAVQVAALTSRTDAEAIARRLSGKGYAAYVLEAESGARAVYKVRVGNYASADEAERVKRRLAQEEKLKPWVIR